MIVLYLDHQECPEEDWSEVELQQMQELHYDREKSFSFLLG